MSADCILAWMDSDIAFFNQFFLKHITVLPPTEQIQMLYSSDKVRSDDLLFQRKLNEAYKAFHLSRPSKPSDFTVASFSFAPPITSVDSSSQKKYWDALALQNMQLQAILFGMISALIEDKSIRIPPEIMRNILFLALGTQHGINYAFIETTTGVEVEPKYKPLFKADIQFGRELYAYRKKHSTSHKREIKTVSSSSTVPESPSALYMKGRFFSEKTLSLASSSTSSASTLSATTSISELPASSSRGERSASNSDPDVGAKLY